MGRCVPPSRQPPLLLHADAFRNVLLRVVHRLGSLRDVERRLVAREVERRVPRDGGWVVVAAPPPPLLVPARVHAS